MIKPYYDREGIQIYHGDCLEIMPQLDRKFDLILTDPPYGMNRFATDGKDYLEKIGPTFKLWPDMLLDKGAAFVFTSTGEVLKVGNLVPLNFRRMLWMYKPADCTYPLEGWLLTSEAILWFSKNGTSNFEERKPFKHDCYIHNKVGHEGVEGHPTVKPLRVIKDFVSRCPLKGSILDPFLGSGTTLVAAAELHRQAVGIEIEEKYCEIAAKRIERVLNQGELFT